MQARIAVAGNSSSPRPNNGTWEAPCRRIDNAMVKAIARALRCREQLKSGTHASTVETAAEKINASYVGCVQGLTLLAPVDGMPPTAKFPFAEPVTVMPSLRIAEYQG